MPCVSIVIPIYNTGENLIPCLESIRNQTFTDYEVVLVDDGSTDGTEAICDRFAALDDRFCVYHCVNAGVATARNRGISFAKGQWVTFIDSDDWIDPHYLEEMVRCAEAVPNCEVVINTKFTVNDDQPVSYREISQELLSSREKTVEALIQGKMPTSMWCCMIRRDRLKSVVVDPAIHYFEDLDFFLQVFDGSSVCALNNAGGYHYRQGSVTHRKLTPKTVTAFDMVDKQRAKGLSDALYHYLDGKMILDVALVGAKDPQYHPDLMKIIQKRAKAFCRRKMPRCHSKKICLYIRMLAVSPHSFYLLHQGKNKLLKR